MKTRLSEETGLLEDIKMLEKIAMRHRGLKYFEEEGRCALGLNTPGFSRGLTMKLPET